MAEGGVSTVDDQFKCPVCFEIFDKPKLLPCFHSFCSACIEIHINKHNTSGTFACPLCRTSIVVPKDGAEGFEENVCLGTASGTADLKVYCELCHAEKEEAAYYCEDCEQNICIRCSKTHSKIKMTSGHRLLELAVLDPLEKRKITSRAFCDVHTEQGLLFFCKKCGLALCIVCKLIGHGSHETTEIQTAAKQFRNVLNSAIKDFLSTENENLIKLASLKKQLEHNLVEEKNRLDAQAKMLHQAIEDFSAELKAKLQARYMTDLRSLDEKIKSKQRDLQSPTRLRDTAELLLDHGSDIELVKKGAALTKHLNAIEQNVPTIDTATTRVYTFCALNKNTLENLLGKVMNTCSYNVINADDIVDKHQLSLIASIKVPGAQSIMSIAPIGNGKAWFSSDGSTNVCLVDHSGNIERRHECDAYIDTVATNTKKECTASSCRYKCIRHVTNDGQVQTLLENLPLYPQGLCYLPSKEACEELLFTCTDGWLGGNSGNCNILQTSGNIRSLKMEINAPLRVATDPVSRRLCFADKDNHAIAICSSSDNASAANDNLGVGGLADDNLADDISRAENSGDEMKLLRKYVDKNVAPCSVCFCGFNCVLIANHNKDIRAISAVGSRCNVLLTRKKFRSVAVDDSDNMWVGLSDGEIEIYKITRK